MALVGLSVQTILVNDIPTYIVPNSIEYDPGFGETNVRSASIGGPGSTSVHTENAENKIGRVKFEMYVTEDSRINIRGWKLLIGANRVTGAQVGGSPFVLNGASMTNNPTFNPTADGTVEVEFMGDPMATP
jgi:hypothetical protein